MPVLAVKSRTIVNHGPSWRAGQVLLLSLVLAMAPGEALFAAARKLPSYSLLLADRPGVTTVVSVAPDGTSGDSFSWDPSISADGRYVVFCSLATDLVPGDTNKKEDIFVRDRQMGQTIRISISADGTQANGNSEWPALSTDGRYVAFNTQANNLVPNDTNGKDDILVYDRQTGETARVSVASDGAQGDGASTYPAISADGRYVAFSSLATNLVLEDSNQRPDVFVHDRQTEQTERVSIASDGTQGNQDSYWPALSADGRYVAFHSTASNLVADDTNDSEDVFVHDRQTGQTERVSISSDGTEANERSYQPAISADGRYVAFYTLATNLVPGDTNGVVDILVHDRQTGDTARVSVASDGTQSNADSLLPALSADGRYVVFESYANNLVADDTNGSEDVFIHDRQTRQTERVSVGWRGAQGNSDSAEASISPDGRYVLFASWASNLAPGDDNGDYDAFVHDREGSIKRLWLPVIVRQWSTAPSGYPE
jgi:Tol biopolymer transport system component